MKFFEVKCWSNGLMIWKAVTFARDSMEAIELVSKQRTFSGPVTFRCNHNPDAFFQ